MIVLRARRTLVDGALRPAAVVVDGSRIAAVLPFSDSVAAREITLADDEVLLPGLVDTHVHVNEPGRTEWEGFASATRAAAAGGVTTIVDMPLNSLPPTVSVAALDAKRGAALGKCAVDVAFWGGAVPGNLTDLRPLHDAGVVGVKAFLVDSGVPEFPPLPDPRPALHALAEFDGLLIAHAEDGALITPATGRRYADFVASRPRASEDSAIAGLLAAARETGARVHIVHLSSADALPLIAAAREDGVRVTVETCPHYLALTAEEVPDGDTRFKCCPPVREADNRDALWQGLVDGTIDMVVSDHSPCTPDLKRIDSGDFGDAWGGIASLQIGLPVVWSEARARGISLADVVTWMSRHPADLVGLTHKGRIEPGADADLTVFAPDATVTVGPLHHRNPITPYAGRTLHGAVRATWLRGTVITDGDAPRGRLLSREDARV
ncbi:MAG: allantoinase AllB [Pseudonocardia sp.]|uniref:allantoinase AllB n=1 Tax=unclassified Pseudonocardia TaxID=2619320 RepID=UPI000A8475B8|nr:MULTISPECIES: allantoinase AllB [unclassified Pseudonocardia]MBN9110033.1 allantoinase AllB [Pseudonocardia sp.]